MMTDLMLKEGLRKSDNGAEVRQVARARTLSAFRRLNGERKGSIVRFLAEAKLLEVCDLSGADLGRANLVVANLSGASLADANLGGANLTGASLADADLSGAGLLQADLRGADLLQADLR